MTNCIKPVGYVLSQGQRYAVACKQRNCPHCALIRRLRLMDRVREFFSDETLRFLTLTISTRDDGNIMSYWHTLMVDLKRHHPGIIGFWVKEYARNGRAHLHMLINRYVDHDWLSRRWLEITGVSYVVDIRKMKDDIKKAGGYMLKYMTKSDRVLDRFAKNERQYGFFGARAPPSNNLEPISQGGEFIQERHWNPSSRMWLDYVDSKGRSVTGWYNVMQRWIGPAFISFMEQSTVTDVRLLWHAVIGNIERDAEKVLSTLKDNSPKINFSVPYDKSQQLITPYDWMVH